MASIIPTDGLAIGERVGSGHCVALLQRGGNMPHTSKWRRGEQVRGADLARGTTIATFEDDGSYGNRMNGSSHAAIYLNQNDHGIRVLDQWIGHPLAERVIRFKNGAGPAVDDGDVYFVIELTI